MLQKVLITNKQKKRERGERGKGYTFQEKVSDCVLVTRVLEVFGMLVKCDASLVRDCAQHCYS